MSNKPSLGETIARLFFAINFTFSPISPMITNLLVNHQQPIEIVDEAGTEMMQRVLPTLFQETYTPPFPEPDINDRRTSPDPDVQEVILPPGKEKKDLEFSLTFSEGDVVSEDVVTLTVHVRNNKGVALADLEFTDALEKGFEFVASSDALLKYDDKTNMITRSIGALASGEEIEFTYQVKVEDKSNASNKVWVHRAELAVAGEKSPQKAKAMFRMVKDNKSKNSQAMDYIDANGGWVDVGNVSVFLPPSAITQQGVVVSTLAQKPGKGPQVQFSLELYKTESFQKENGKPAEQNVKIKNKWASSFLTEAFIEVNFDEIVDLSNVPAGKEPYVATYDEEHQVWVKVPILSVDAENNKAIIKSNHFSTWGAGLGDALPQNGAGALLFDQPYTSLFTGSSRYSIPVWTPPGRVGMQPSISLSYSSATVDGVLGDVQSPWVGVGWNIDGVEIVRKITTDENGYGYENDFALTINGTKYDLIRDEYIPNLYYTKRGSFLYIERHNVALGNEQGVSNSSGEWWEVVSTDGTRYRLGYHEDSEQLALMYGYACTSGSPCNTPEEAYAHSGYAGVAEDMVVRRWRVDRVEDIHGNYIEYSYAESHPDPTSQIPQFDVESYIEAIRYTGYEKAGQPSLDPNFQVVFERAARDTGVIPIGFNVWDHYDSQYLDAIGSYSCVGGCDSPNAISNDVLIRDYDFSYSIATDEFEGKTYSTLMLEKISISGGVFGVILTTTAPDVTFTYEMMANRDDDGETQNPWPYPRLTRIDNGYGGAIEYTYENDDDEGSRDETWYNWRVSEVELISGDRYGLGTEAIQKYTYSDPEYDYYGEELIGYEYAIETSYEPDGTTRILKTKHTFGIEGLDVGRELTTEIMDAATSVVLRKNVNYYVTDNSQAPFVGWNYRYLGQTEYYQLIDEELQMLTKTSYIRDGGTGSLLAQFTYLRDSLERQTHYEYFNNPDPDVYLLGKIHASHLLDRNNQAYAATYYHYDHTVNDNTVNTVPPTLGELTLVQTRTGLDGDQTVDVEYEYDIYGNLTDTYVFTAYGEVGTDPNGFNQHSETEYDSTYHTYPVTITDALGKSSTTDYYFELGLPKSVEDPNGLITLTKYDGLGRVTEVTPPSLTTPGIKYDYPEPDSQTGQIGAPYAIQMQIYDTYPSTAVYRNVFAIYDGLGRIIQNQVENATNNSYLITDTDFNAQGAVSRQSVAEENAIGGGIYMLPNWNNIEFTESSYDLLGRPLQVTAPGGQVTQTNYDGLTTTITNANGEKTSQTVNELGQLVKVQEYIDEGQTVYATTSYEYDAAGRLVYVFDAQMNTTTILYNWLGQKTGMQDPDMGIWTYAYNPTGTLNQQIDARNESLTFAYDDLNRITAKSDGNGTIATYTYGNAAPDIGMRVAMTDDSGGSTVWDYRNDGLTVEETRTFGSESYSMTTNMDWLGRVESIVYDEGDTNEETIAYSYDALGRPDGFSRDAFSTNLATLAYNTLGQITSVDLGNGANIANTYGTSGADIYRLLNRTVDDSSDQEVLNFDYTYDPLGNITQIDDNYLGEVITYEYDDLNRLISAEASIDDEISYYQYYEYDQIGNITNWVDYESDVIFKDDFESNGLSSWTTSAIDNGDLSVSQNAGYFGSLGMQAVIDDTNDIFVRDDSPNSEKSYNVRFYFDPNSVDIPSSDFPLIFGINDAATTWQSFGVFLKEANPYALQIAVMKDDDTWEYSDWFDVENDWMSIELHFTSSPTPGTDSGSLSLLVNDDFVGEITEVDNDLHPIDKVKIGAMGVDTGTTGTIYFDSFESRRITQIGGVDPSDTIFQDGFESGDLLVWDDQITDGGDLTASTSAEYYGSFGMQAVIDDTNALYVKDENPDSETSYRARFYFDPNTVVIPTDDIAIAMGIDETATSSESFAIYLKKPDPGPYSLRLALMKDDGNWEYSDWYDIEDDWMSIELHFTTSLSLGDDSGSLSLWINDEYTGGITGVDNDLHQIDHITLGAMDVNSGTSGTIYFDEFESRRVSSFGSPLPVPTQDPGPDRFFEANGEVVMEAEHNTGTVAGTDGYANRVWTSTTALSGYVGDSAMQVLPNSGATASDINGPAMTYTVEFNTPGTYYVYVRMRGDGSDNSVHVGLDGVRTGTKLTGGSAGAFVWQNSADGGDATITIPSAGMYTFYLWMREDGTTVDRIWLSTTDNVVANGSTIDGPSESYRQVSFTTSDFTVGEALNDAGSAAKGFNALSPVGSINIFSLSGGVGTGVYQPLLHETPTIAPTATQTPEPSITPTDTPTATLTPTATPLPTNSIIAYWDFNDDSDSTIEDSVGINDLTLQWDFINWSWNSDGVDGKSLIFNGTNSWVDGPDSSLEVGNGLTLMGWFKPYDYPENYLNGETDEENTSYVIFKGKFGYTYGINLSPEGYVEFQLKLDGEEEKVIGPRLPLNQWSFVAVAFEESTGLAEIYVNGVKVAASELTGELDYTDSRSLWFGHEYSHLYKGELDEISLYDRALTQAEIIDEYDNFTVATPTPTPIVSPTPMPTQAADTNDGAYTVALGETFNLNTDDSDSSGCPDGAAYSVTDLTAGYAEVSDAPDGCLAAGDEILLINLMGTSSYYRNVGRYEFLRVLSVDDTTITFQEAKIGFYGEEIDNDANIGIDTDQQRVMIMRVPNYSSLTINGTLTANAFNRQKYGVVVFRVNGTLQGTGSIDADALGYRGGEGAPPDGETGYPGESYLGKYAAYSTANYGGGGGGGRASIHIWETKGNGGGYGSYGEYTTGDGGATYGNKELTSVYLGSGGGGSGSKKDDTSPGSPGGNGGGIILAYADVIDFGSGTLSSEGAIGGGYGANGSGGSIRIEAPSMSNAGTITAMGGNDGEGKGIGGDGRVAIYYDDSIGSYDSEPMAFTDDIDNIGILPQPPDLLEFTPVGMGGTGADGAVSIASGETVNLQTDNLADFRACGNGGDAPAYAVIELTATYAKLSEMVQDTCLAAGDEILLINMEGNSTNYENVGNYEFLRVGAVSWNTVYFTTPKVNFYGDAAGSDDDIVDEYNDPLQHVMIQRVPNYSSMTIDGTLTTSAWDGQTGGVLAFRVGDLDDQTDKVLSGSGTIDLDGLGYRGGERGEDGYPGTQGESYPGIGETGTLNNGGGGGGGANSDGGGRAGGGGGYGSAGEAVASSGLGGIVYGDERLDVLFLGSGGGGSGADNDNIGVGFPGNPGGGALLVFAEQINFTGTMSVQGSSEIAKGGNGSGGSVRLEAESLSVTAIDDSGGAEVEYGGDGGDGRTAIYCLSFDACNLPSGYDGYVAYVEIPGEDLIFADNFESMNTATWDDEVTTGGDLTVSSAASYIGNYGMQIVVDDVDNDYVESTMTGGENEYHARFYFDPNSVDMGASEEMAILYGYDTNDDPNFAISIREASPYEIKLSVMDNGQNWSSTTWTAIPDDWMAIELEYQTATAAGQNDGFAKLWVDDESAGTVTGLVDVRRVVSVHLGTTWITVDQSTNGTVYFDAFESHRYSPVGMIDVPEGDPPTNPPAEAIWLQNVYKYDGLQPHAVTEVERDLAAGGSYTDEFTYDANGNMICRDENGQVWKQEYNSENRLSVVKKMNGTDCGSMGTADETWTFYYDGDGVRIKEEYWNGTTTTTKLFLFGGSYEVENPGAGETVTKYYSLAGMMVAMDDGTDVFYFASDHLTSASVVSDDDGDLAKWQRYLPFGEVRTDVGTGITETDFGYTNQRNYADMGLMDYHARFYSPYLNRWTQPDTIIPNLYDPQSLNRYAYVRNNPVKYTDPSGHTPSVPTPLPKNDEDGGYTLLEIIGAILVVAVVDAPRRHGMNTTDGGCNDSLAVCFDQKEVKDFSPSQDIDETEFEEFLGEVYQDIDDSLLRTIFDPARSDYDTPFYTGNRNGILGLFKGTDRPDQMVTINGVDYHQSAVNYVAQGMYVAKTPLKLKKLGIISGIVWNRLINNSKMTEEEKFWFNYGYDYFEDTKEKEKINKDLQ